MLCGTVGAIGICAVFVLDMSVTGYLMNGFYVIPLFFLALAVNWRAVAFAGAACIALSAFVFVWEDSLGVDRWLILLYAVMIGAALVVLSYLIARLSTMTEYASFAPSSRRRARTSWAAAAPATTSTSCSSTRWSASASSSSATSGVLLLLEDGEWAGRAGFGLGVDARQIIAPYPELPLAVQALRTDAAVSRDFTDGDPAPVGAARRARAARARARACPCARSSARSACWSTTGRRTRASTAASRSRSPRASPATSV